MYDTVVSRGNGLLDLCGELKGLLTKISTYKISTFFRSHYEIKLEQCEDSTAV